MLFALCGCFLLCFYTIKRRKAYLFPSWFDPGMYTNNLQDIPYSDIYSIIQILPEFILVESPDIFVKIITDGLTIEKEGEERFKIIFPMKNQMYSFDIVRTNKLNIYQIFYHDGNIVKNLGKFKKID